MENCNLCIQAVCIHRTLITSLAQRTLQIIIALSAVIRSTRPRDGCMLFKGTPATTHTRQGCAFASEQCNAEAAVMLSAASYMWTSCRWCCSCEQPASKHECNIAAHYHAFCACIYSSLLEGASLRPHLQFALLHSSLPQHNLNARSARPMRLCD